MPPYQTISNDPEDAGERVGVAFGTGSHELDPSVPALRVSIPNAGTVYTVAHPFITCDHDMHEQDPVTGYWEPVPVKSWRPGVNFEETEYGRCESFADAEGQMVLTVVSVAPLPKPYQSRVFYTRKFIDPCGKSFGKTGLRVDTIEKFRRISQRYAHTYDIEPSTAAEKLLASAIEARSGETEGLDPQGESAVAQPDAQPGSSK